MLQREDSCKYLEGLRTDYRVKLQDKFWKDFHSLIREELFKTEYKLHQLKEQELCLHFQLEGISRSTFLMTNEICSKNSTITARLPMKRCRVGSREGSIQNSQNTRTKSPLEP